MFHSPCCISTPSPAPAESTVSEGQGISRTNAPPPANHPQTSPSYLTPLPALLELPPLGQQNTEPTSFGLVTIDPSLQSEPVDDLPPATDPEPGVCLCVLSNTKNSIQLPLPTKQAYLPCQSCSTSRIGSQDPCP